MKVLGCFCRLKAITVLVNLLLLLLGVVVMSIGICHKYLCFSNHWYLQIIEESRKYFDLTLLRVSSAMLGVGAQMVLLGILGCYGTWNNSLCILGICLTFLVVLLVEEITVIMWPPAYKNAIKTTLDSIVTKEYAKNISSTIERFDYIQKQLNCCGSAGPLDWSDSNYMADSIPPPSDTDVVTGNDNSKFILPSSCCKNSSSEKCHEYIMDVYKNNINNSIINTQVITTAP